MSEQNPFGLHTITPYLVIEDVRATIAFAQEIFGAELRGEPKMRDDGSVMHAEIKIGDSVVMMGEPMDGWDSLPSMLYVYVDDCDAQLSKALAAGAREVMPAADYPHGDRYGIVSDACGNMWCLVTHVGGGKGAA